MVSTIVVFSCVETLTRVAAMFCFVFLFFIGLLLFTPNLFRDIQTPFYGIYIHYKTTTGSSLSWRWGRFFFHRTHAERAVRMSDVECNHHTAYSQPCERNGTSWASYWWFSLECEVNHVGISSDRTYIEFDHYDKCLDLCLFMQDRPKSWTERSIVSLRWSRLAWR